MSDLTPETIAHLRELDAARTQGEWRWHPYRDGGMTLAVPNRPLHEVNILKTTDDWPPASADADFIAMAANHMGALLDAAEELEKWRKCHVCTVDCRPNYHVAFVGRQALEMAGDEASRLRAELAEEDRRVEAADGASRILYARIADLLTRIERVTALADKWDEDRALYPTNSDARAVPAAVAVRLCTEELRAALAPATQREEGE